MRLLAARDYDSPPLPMLAFPNTKTSAAPHLEWGRKVAEPPTDTRLYDVDMTASLHPGEHRSP